MCLQIMSILILVKYISIVKFSITIINALQNIPEFDICFCNIQN